jgi:hypothetical protein
MKRRDLLAAATLGVTGIAGCAQVPRAETTREETFRPPEGALSVVTRADDVTVEPTDAEAVQVTVRNRHGPGGTTATRLETVRSGGDLTLTVPDHGRGGPWGAEVDLEVGLPAGVALGSVTAADGDVRVSGIESGVAAETDDGDVAVRGTGGDVTTATDDGDATVDDVGGNVTATTVDGDVAVSGAGGYVTAEVEDGDVSVYDPGGVAGVDARNGDVSVDVTAVREDVRVATANGDIAAGLAADLDATVVLVTDDGDLTVPGDVFDAVEEDTPTYVRGRLGPGTHTVRIQTRAGDVTVDTL